MQSPSLQLAIAMALSGTIGVFVVQSTLDPINFVFWRCIFGAMSLGIWCLVRGLFSYFHRRDIIAAVACGALIVCSWVLFFTSYGLTSIATATIVYHIQPFFVIICGVLFLKEKVTRLQIAWIAAAFIGVALSSGLFSKGTTGEKHALMGVLLALLAAAAYALITIITKGIRSQRAEITTFWQLATGAILLAPFAGYSHLPGWPAWGWIIGAGVILTGLCYALMFNSYPHLSTATISSLTFIYPLVAILCDNLVYGHRLTAIQYIGAVLIAVATLGARFRWSMPRGAAIWAGPREDLDAG
ncbi:drug/metabolite transporter superfamily permease [Gluconacetobacter sacchari DSM 12717]|uniref:DMT family transporter n=2 Tax=Gluconacetobacter sacchari TaxID=92759 RepID=A0A7W4NQC7_9PROT|nr:DMT family transporter [Gluconacetobacter sacchari]MBB2162282.1 DMT family transporter [Gluconacetobacter sacchari]GBQ22569.1 drug/metabolite transporter superfamily permease [Gluconacetobacter sacchari DSM 12717]